MEAEYLYWNFMAVVIVVENIKYTNVFLNTSLWYTLCLEN